MSIRRAFRALNAAGQASGSRASSQNYSLSIEKLNIKQRIVRIVTIRSILTLRVMMSNPVLNYI